MKLYVGVPCWVPFWPDFTGFLPSFHSVPSFVRTLGSVGRRRRFRFFFVFLSIRLISNDAMLNDSVAVVSFVFLFLVSFLFCFWGSVSVFGDTTWFYRVFFLLLLVNFFWRPVPLLLYSVDDFLLVYFWNFFFFCFFHDENWLVVLFFLAVRVLLIADLPFWKKYLLIAIKKILRFSQKWIDYSFLLIEPFSQFGSMTSVYLVLLGFPLLLGFT